MKCGGMDDSPTAQDGIILEVIRCATRGDTTMQNVIELIQSQRWYEISDPNLQPYKNVRTELIIPDGLVLRGDKLVTPQQLQQKAIQIAHKSHREKNKEFLARNIMVPMA